MAKNFKQLREKMTDKQKLKSAQIYQQMLADLENPTQVEATKPISIRQSLLERFERYANQTGKNTQTSIDEALEYWLATH